MFTHFWGDEVATDGMCLCVVGGGGNYFLLPLLLLFSRKLVENKILRPSFFEAESESLYSLAL